MNISPINSHRMSFGKWSDDRQTQNHIKNFLAENNHNKASKETIARIENDPATVKILEHGLKELEGNKYCETRFKISDNKGFSTLVEAISSSMNEDKIDDLGVAINTAFFRNDRTVNGYSICYDPRMSSSPSECLRAKAMEIDELTKHQEVLKNIKD